MLTLVKLGGSLITDKNKRNTYRPDVAARVARELATALRLNPDLSLILGHGSGSFGHFEASEHNTINGVRTQQEWAGFSKVAAVAAELNRLMIAELQNAAIMAMRFQPSASVQVQDGKITHWDLSAMQMALSHGLVPVVYGDVAFDSVRGGTITSTETLFDYLAVTLDVKRVILVGEVDGIYDQAGHVIPLISPSNFDDIRSALGRSRGVDVTGGMATKVRDMLALVQARPKLIVQVINGLQPDALLDTLSSRAIHGTRIAAD